MKSETKYFFFVNLIRDHQKTESEKSELEIHAKSGYLTNLIGRFLSWSRRNGLVEINKKSENREVSENSEKSETDRESQKKARETAKCTFPSPLCET